MFPLNAWKFGKHWKTETFHELKSRNGDDATDSGEAGGEGDDNSSELSPSFKVGAFSNSSDS